MGVVAESVFTPILVNPDFNWQQPGNTGNTGGGSSVPHGTYSIDTVQNITVYPVAGDPWDTFYFYDELKPQPDATRLSQSISFLFPSKADLDACNAVEWELEKCVDGNVWNMGWQWLLSPSPQIRVFDYTTKNWASTNIPASLITPAPGMAVELHTEHILSETQAEHIALWINGSKFLTSYFQPMFPNRWPDKPNYLHYSFQLDSKGQGIPFTVQVGKMSEKYL